MEKGFRWPVRAVAIALLLSAPAPAAADAPWPVFQHDLQHTGRTTVVGPPQAGVKWTFPTVLAPLTPAVAADGTIYQPTGTVGADAGTLYAINPNGTQKWAFTLPGPPASTPAVGGDGTIYVHAYGPGNIAAIEHLVAVNPNGTQKWDVTHFGGGVAVLTSSNQSSPVVATDGRIWVGSKDGGLYSLNAADGSISCAVAATRDIQSAPAIATNGTVYVVTTDSKLSAYNSSCALQWTFALSSGITPNPQSPAVAGDGTIWVGDRDERLVGVNSNGTEKCRFTTGSDIDSTPAVGADGTIYAGSDGLYAVDPANCSQKWKFPSMGTVLFSSASPIVDGDGTVYWRESFTAYAVNPNGTQKWSIAVGSGTGAALHPSGAISASGVLYLADGGLGGSNRLRALADVVPPAAPTLTDTDPDSPSGENSPAVKGTAEAGSTVRLYTDATCTSAIAGQGTAAALASPGLTVTVPANSTTTFHATATDAAGNTSTCSTSAITYTEDSTAPQTTITGGPSGTSADPTPTFTFVASEAGATFACRTDSGSFTACTSPHTTAPLADGAHIFEVRATDTRGNVEVSPASRIFFVLTTPGEGPLPPEEDTSVSLSLTAKSPQRAVRQKGVLAVVRCPEESCTVVARGYVDIPARAAAAKRYRLRSVTRDLSAGRRTTLKLGFSRKLLQRVRTALRNPRTRTKLRATVSVTATDAAGNSRTRKTSVRLRR